MEQVKEIEKSIIKKYRKDIWSEFTKAVKEYELIKKGDSIAVCISGGKDSFLLAKLLEELQRHSKIKFDLKYIVMNPGYKEETLNQIKENAKILNLPIEIFNTEVFKIARKLDKEKPCYMCARMRRGYLYDYAQKLKCNKIALGHHFNDVIETILLSTLYGAEFKTMLPKLKAKNFKKMELIRPLYLVREENIIKWAESNSLKFLDCSCDFVKKENDSKRKKIKQLIKELKKDNQYIEYNIFKSTHNVNLKTLISYKKKDKEIHFLDKY